jgi:hypothetical protein
VATSKPNRFSSQVQPRPARALKVTTMNGSQPTEPDLDPETIELSLAPESITDEVLRAIIRRSLERSRERQGSEQMPDQSSSIATEP